MSDHGVNIASEEYVMIIAAIGIDLAKNVFTVHGNDHNGKTFQVKSRVTRTVLSGLIAGG
jgi:transposase